jgi:predicted PurR-regulated permease PerM
METRSPTRLFVRHALIALALLALALLLWRIAYALLLAFGGVLFAVVLRGFADKLRAWTGLGMRASLAVVCAVFFGALALAALTIGPAVAGELGQLQETLAASVQELRAYLEKTPWGRQLLEMMELGAQHGGTLVAAAAGLLRGAFDALLALVLIFFVGLYLAFSPGVYVEGFVRLFPKARQDRLRETLHAAGQSLWLWLLGQLAVMLAVGVLTAVGLALIGVPLALALGLIAGLLEFIPFLGPFLAAIPVLLVAFSVDPITALYAGLLFLGIQQLEGNVLTPLVQRRAVDLPPVLLIIATLAFTLLFGIMGAIFAAPLLVVVVVLIKMLYMEDVLGERVEVPGAK